MALGSTQSLTKIVPGVFLEVNLRLSRKAYNLTAICGRSLENVGASTSHNPIGLLQGWLYFFYLSSGLKIYVLARPSFNSTHWSRGTDT
jgi:hypothetical protein